MAISCTPSDLVQASRCFCADARTQRAISAFLMCRWATISDYLLYENFEGVGRPSNWTDTGGNADYDYTVNPLEGLQSYHYITGVTSVAPLSREVPEAWAYFMWRAGTLSTVAFFALRNSVGGIVLSLTCLGTGILRLTVGGTVSTPIGFLSTNTNYNFWVHYIKGTGADAFGEVFVSTNGIKPATPALTLNNGTPTTNAEDFRISGGTTANLLVIDKIRVSATEIGSNPV